MRGLIFLMLGCGLLNCNATKNTAARSKDRPAVQQLQLERKTGESRIAFLTLGLWLQDSVKDEYGFTQKAILYAEGKIKKQTIFAGQYENYQLYWEIRNAKKDLVAVGNVPDPLYRSFETSGEHSGQMEKHLLSSQSGEIMLRFNLDDDARSVAVYKLSNGKPKKLYEANIL